MDWQMVPNNTIPSVLNHGNLKMMVETAGERRQVSVIFSPESATEMNHKIVFKARFSVAKQTAQSPHFKALQFKTLPEI